jgi:hypothetical protein
MAHPDTSCIMYMKQLIFKRNPEINFAFENMTKKSPKSSLSERGTDTHLNPNSNSNNDIWILYSEERICIQIPDANSTH